MLNEPDVEATTPPVVPCSCCQSVAAFHLSPGRESSGYVMCEGGACWSGPVRASEQDAVLAWNTLHEATGACLLSAIRGLGEHVASVQRERRQLRDALRVRTEQLEQAKERYRRATRRKAPTRAKKKR